MYHVVLSGLTPMAKASVVVSVDELKTPMVQLLLFSVIPTSILCTIVLPFATTVGVVDAVWGVRGRATGDACEIVSTLTVPEPVTSMT